MICFGRCSVILEVTMMMMRMRMMKMRMRMRMRMKMKTKKRRRKIVLKSIWKGSCRPSLLNLASIGQMKVPVQ
uniref:Alternative protein TAF7L n=1 Tax=Homo sapiens TaxID=9606 RepID=L8E974_HUMAN|nr:alternative protein TAF7L [Homo sapiens]